MAVADRPLVLLTNDDGVRSPPMRVLAEAMAEVAEVVVVAPDRDQSAVSHMISLHRPIRAVEQEPGWWAVEGTPADCVYLGVHELLHRKPDFILSGINTGANLGTDVHYSGTVSGAIEGTLMGVSSMALSMVSRSRANYPNAARFARALTMAILADGGLPRSTTLNVNFPGGAPSTHQLTFLGHRAWEHTVHTRVDPRGRNYYWIGGDSLAQPDVAGSDATAVSEGVISVTPLMLDLTDRRFLGKAGYTLDGFEGAAAVPSPEGWWLGE